MARKKLQEPEKWITVNGQHLPVYPGGIIGQPGQKEPKDESSTQKDPSVSLERKLAEGLKKYNHPSADKEAYNMIQAYKKGQIAPEQLTMWGVSKDELKALSEQGKKEAQADINAGRNTRKVIDPMGNVVKKKAKTEYEKHYGVDMKKNEQSSTPKKTGLKTNLPPAGEKFLKETTAKNNKFRMGMSKEERKQFLDNAPAGTRISGLINKRTGHEMIVEKVEEYRAVYGGVGAGSKIHDTVWKIGGYTEPYIAKTLREAEEGTNKYYEFKQPKKKK